MSFYNYLATFLMIGEIFIAENLFVWKAPRRSYFPVRLSSSVLVMCAFSFAIQFLFTMATNSELEYGQPVSFSVSLFKFFFYLLIFIMTLASLACSYRISFFSVLLYGSGGYALQHIGANVNYLFLLIPSYHTLVNQNPYLGLASELPVMVFIDIIGFFLFIKGKKFVPERAERMKKRIFFSLFVILICIGLSRLTRDNAERQLVSILAESFYAIISCVLVLIILYVLNQQDVMEEKVAVMNDMLHREKQQYIQSKENIQLINIKVHDLKHQLQLLKRDHSEKDFDRMEQAIKIYDTQYHTGNDALDIILADKSLQCEKNDITLTCSCNGKELDFMEESDIYSLFGNALSNAIEAVSVIKDKQKRCISLVVRNSTGVEVIHMENYFEGQLTFENGLPQTRKDQDWHGFGMKSMAMIAQKYHGSIATTSKGNVFYLDVLIPLTGKV